MSDDDFERLLRATLSERAESAPEPSRLTERVLAAVDLESNGVVPHVTFGSPTPIAAMTTRSRQRRRARILVPLASAASVAAVVGLSLLLTANGSKTTSGNGGVGVSYSQSNPALMQPTAGVVPDASAGSSVQTPPTTVSAVPSIAATDSVLPNGFQLVDLTYDSTTSAFALGTVPCSIGRCTTLARSTNGRSWLVAAASLPFTVSGAADRSSGDEVTHIRFANSSVGYAYGAKALFATTDGGTSWQRGDAMTFGIELAGSTAVTLQGVSCTTSSCRYEIDAGTPGSVALPPATVPVTLTGSGAQLARAGQNAFVSVNTAAGDLLVNSVDGGLTWAQASTNVCPASASTAASDGTPPSSSASTASDSPTASFPANVVSLAAASDGSVAALCSSSTGQFVAVSSNGGKSFTPGTGLPASTGSIVSAASSSVIVVAGSTLTRSTDAGLSWAPVTGVPSLGSTRWLGFEDATHGAWVGGTSTSVWSTTDAGVSYAQRSFS